MFRNNESHYQDFCPGTDGSRHKHEVQGLFWGWDSPRIPHRLCLFTLLMSRCPLCLIPLLPFIRMGLKPQSRRLLCPPGVKCRGAGPFQGSLTANHSSKGSKNHNCTSVYEQRSFLPVAASSRADTRVAISWLSALGSQDVPCFTVAELRDAPWMATLAVHPTAPGHLHGCYNPLHQAASQSSSKCRKKITHLKTMWQKSIEEKMKYF